MIYYLGTYEDAEELVSICRKYDEDIDIIRDRYIVDGKSLLGVMSFIGQYVEITIHTENKEVAEKLRNELFSKDKDAEENEWDK